MNQNNMCSFIEFLNFCMIFIILVLKKSSASDPMYEACAPKACGNVTIRYPFYIQGLQNPYCGYPGFELDCRNNQTPVIHVPENYYVIDKIFDENQTLRVHTAAVSSNGDCLPQIKNITANPQYGIVDTSRLHLLSNCKSPLSDALSRYHIRFCDNQTSDALGLAMFEDDKNLNIALEECKINVLAPVEVDEAERGNGVIYYEGLLSKGFVLNWTATNCSRCERSGGRCGFDGSSYWCYCTDRPYHVSCKSGTKKDMVIIAGTVLPVAGFMILVILAYCFRRKFSFLEICGRTENFENVEAFFKNYGSLAPKRYYYSEVKKMTDSFKTKLGKGGYGCVYKGKLHDGSPIAVKVLKESKGSGEEFINEVASISRTSHVNIVTLLGFCFQGPKRALIFEFMPNGSLEKFIYGGTASTSRQLGLQTLYKIAVGIARGLEYLHRGCNTRIVHLDIKPHNILLDEDFCPKISDFGLAKLCPGKESIVSLLGARGTVGYIAPEIVCKSLGGVSHKSDVYSYGMMIFEMVGGRKNIEVKVDHSSEIYFPDWIYRKIDQGDNLGLDGIMNEEENELARKMIIVSLWCIQTDPSSRPSITNVVEMLEGSLQVLQIPPKPVFSSPSRASEGFSTVNIT